EADSIEDLDWRYAVLVWTRVSPTGTTEDAAQIGFNITNITLGDLDKSWTTTDFTDCETALAEWYTVILGLQTSGVTLKEIRWYPPSFTLALPIGLAVPQNDPATGKPFERFAHTGPPVRIKPVNVPGSALGQPLPYQVAASITLKTATPKHWGR